MALFGSLSSVYFRRLFTREARADKDARKCAAALGTTFIISITIVELERPSTGDAKSIAHEGRVCTASPNECNQ